MNKFYELIIKNFTQITTSKFACIVLIALAIGYLNNIFNIIEISYIDFSKTDNSISFFKLTLVSIFSFFTSVLLVNIFLILYSSLSTKLTSIFKEHKEKKGKKLTLEKKNNNLQLNFKIYLNHLKSYDKNLFNSLLESEQEVYPSKNPTIHYLLKNNFIKFEYRVSSQSIIVSLNPIVRDVYKEYLKNKTIAVLESVKPYPELFKSFINILEKRNHNEATITSEQFFEIRDILKSTEYSDTLRMYMTYGHWFIKFECPEIKVAAEEYCNKELYNSASLIPDGEILRTISQS